MEAVWQVKQELRRSKAEKNKKHPRKRDAQTWVVVDRGQAIPITIERKVSFRMLHQKCNTPISYRLFCEEGDEVPKSEISFGYKLRARLRCLGQKEIDSAKPVSSKLIELDKFIEFFQVDPHYFEDHSS